MWVEVLPPPLFWPQPPTLLRSYTGNQKTLPEGISAQVRSQNDAVCFGRKIAILVPEGNAPIAHTEARPTDHQGVSSIGESWDPVKPR